VNSDLTVEIVRVSLNEMKNSFTSLSRAETVALHKEIRRELEVLTAVEIEEEYRSLKEEHEDLRRYVEAGREKKDARALLKGELKKSREEEESERRKAFEGMNFIAKVGSVFSGSKPLSEAQESALRKSREISSRIEKLGSLGDSPEVFRRKQIYHRLKVVAEIRKEFKDERTKSLAKAKMNQVRNTSATLKRRHLARSGEFMKCPYCDIDFDASKLVLDHIYPVARGGLDTDENTVLVCSKCNRMKSDITLLLFCERMNFEFWDVCQRLKSLGKAI
jgi:5-methylcytosine-specific restriction endonuclease McrA